MEKTETQEEEKKETGIRVSRLEEEKKEDTEEKKIEESILQRKPPVREIKFIHQDKNGQDFYVLESGLRRVFIDLVTNTRMETKLPKKVQGSPKS